MAPQGSSRPRDRAGIGGALTSWWGRWGPVLRRRRWLLATLVLLLLVRVNLPWILRRVIVSQVSEALRADVALGDVDLALYKAGVRLEEFAIGVRGPIPGVHDGGAGDVATASPASAPPLPPILAWKSLVVSMRWWPLVRKTVQLREIILDSPRVELDRLASGEFNFEALIQAAAGPTGTGAPDGAPGATPAAAPNAAPVPRADHGGPTSPPDASERVPTGDGGGSDVGSSGWWMGIDRVALRGGHVRFHDHTLEGSEPIDVAIPTIEIRDISMSPDMYGKPSESRLRVGLDEGTLEVGARAATPRGGIDLECDLRATALPLRHARLYIPQVGWSELTGKLDADLTYRLQTARGSEGSEAGEASKADTAAETGASDTASAPNRRNGVNEVRGTVALRDLAVRVPDLPGAALSWTRLAVRVDPIDLIGQVAAIAEVDLSNAWVAVRPKSIVQLPVIAGPGDGANPEDAGSATGTPAGPQDTPPPPAPAGEPSDIAAPAKSNGGQAATALPWRWAVEAIRVSDSGVRLLSDDAALEVRLGARVTNVVPSPDAVTQLALSIGVGDGSVQVEGRARVEPPGFAGDVTVSGVALPEPLAMSGAAPEGLLESATLDARVAVEAGMAKPEAAALGTGDVRVTGTMSLADAVVRSADTEIGVARADVEVGELSLAGVLPGASAPLPSEAARGTLRLRGRLGVHDASVGLVPSPSTADVTAAGAEPPGDARAAATGTEPTGRPRAGGARTQARPALPVVTGGADFVIRLAALDLSLSELTLPNLAGDAPGGAAPMRAAIAALTIEKPMIRLTRAAAGIVLPGAEAAPASGDGTPSAAGAPPPAPGTPAAAPATAGAGLELALDSLRVTKGRFAFADRTLRPPFSATFDDITVSGRGLRVPELAAEDVRVALTTPGEGEIELSGRMAPRGGRLELEVQDVALVPYNPYATALTPYRIASGALSLSTGVKRSGRRYEIANEITLADLDVEGAAGEGIFERQFGIPLATALALLRDPAGNITLGVPVEIDERGTSVDVMTVVGSALRRALLGALTSPLKLVGSLTGGEDKIGSFAAVPIVFRVGRAEVTHDGAAVIERLAKLLESRPAMGVELEAAVTAADARWMHEQALLARWREEGFLAGLRALPDRGGRTRVREALEGRAREERGELSADDAAALDGWLRDVPAPTPEELRGLAAARIAAVGSRLRAGTSIEEARVVGLEPAGTIQDAPAPAVEIKLRPASKLRPAARDTLSGPTPRYPIGSEWRSK